MSNSFAWFAYFAVISPAAILKRHLSAPTCAQRAGRCGCAQAEEMLAKLAPVCVRTRTGRRKVWAMPEAKTEVAR